MSPCSLPVEKGLTAQTGIDSVRESKYGNRAKAKGGTGRAFGNQGGVRVIEGRRKMPDMFT